MTHARWVTRSPTADNGGIHSFSQPLPVRAEFRKNAGVHSSGLFPLMVKTFCSGSNQAQCSPHFIFMRWAKDGKESEMKRTKEEKGNSEKSEQEGLTLLPIHASRSLQLPQKVKLSGEGGGGDQWGSRSVKSCRVVQHVEEVGGFIWRQSSRLWWLNVSPDKSWILVLF